MQCVADAERHAADELGVDQRRIHRASDVGANDDAAQADRAGVAIDVHHDGGRAARIRELLHLERRAGGQCALGGELGERDAMAAGLEHARRVGNVALGHRQPRGGTSPGFLDQLLRGEMCRVAGRHRAARAVGSDPALDRRGVRVAHVEARRGNAERVAENLRQDRLEARPHRRSARVDDDATVRADRNVCGLERAEARLLHVDRQADPAARARRQAVDHRLLGARVGVVESPQQLVEERGEIAGVVDRRHAERFCPAVIRHLVGAHEVAAADLRGIEAEPRRAGVE